MQVLVGNPKPVELALERVTLDDGATVVRQVLRPIANPEAVTRLFYPDGMSVEDAALATVDALKYHMDRDAVPAWIECDSKELHKVLCQHYGLKTTAKRPGNWGMTPAGVN